MSAYARGSTVTRYTAATEFHCLDGAVVRAQASVATGYGTAAYRWLGELRDRWKTPFDENRAQDRRMSRIDYIGK